MNNNELAHVGIMGMRWGHRSASATISRQGKPHTVTSKSGRTSARGGSKDTNNKKIEDARKDEIAGNAKSLYKHRKEFTASEMRTAVERLRLENEVGKMSKSEVTKGMDIAKKVIDGAKMGVDAYNTFKAVQGIVKGMSKIAAPVAAVVVPITKAVT